MTLKTSVCLSLCLILVLSLAGCSSNQVITAITVAVDAAEVALPIVTSSVGVDPALATQLTNYLAATGQALSAATEILAKNETPAQQATEITAAFAGIALPNLPAGLPVGIATAVQKVALLVSQFIGNLPTASAASRFDSPYILAFKKQAKPLKLSQKDKDKLQKLHDRAARIASHKK